MDQIKRRKKKLFSSGRVASSERELSELMQVKGCAWECSHRSPDCACVVWRGVLTIWLFDGLDDIMAGTLGGSVVYANRGGGVGRKAIGAIAL